MKRLETVLNQSEQSNEEAYPVKTIELFKTKALTENLNSN